MQKFICHTQLIKRLYTADYLLNPKIASEDERQQPKFAINKKIFVLRKFSSKLNGLSSEKFNLIVSYANYTFHVDTLVGCRLISQSPEC